MKLQITRLCLQNFPPKFYQHKAKLFKAGLAI